MADWNKIDSHGAVEDRRGSVVRMGSYGIGTIAVLALLNYALTGTVDVNTLTQQLEQLQSATPREATSTNAPDDYEQFASAVLGSTNDAWTANFAKMKKAYTPPHFVLFRQATDSSCGGAYSEVGPHYCPTDQTVYLDETFFAELTDRFGASGDVAQAYVIAHEVGHHVQTLLGIEKPSIALELQADCFAGMWAYSIRDKQVLEPGEIKEALDAASAVGDDHIQEVTTGRVNQETWTHGSSAQRVSAFNLGYSSGSFEKCQTL